MSAAYERARLPHMLERMRATLKSIEGDLARGWVPGTDATGAVMTSVHELVTSLARLAAYDRVEHPPKPLKAPRRPEPNVEIDVPVVMKPREEWPAPVGLGPAVVRRTRVKTDVKNDLDAQVAAIALCLLAEDGPLKLTEEELDLRLSTTIPDVARALRVAVDRGVVVATTGGRFELPSGVPIPAPAVKLKRREVGT